MLLCWRHYFCRRFCDYWRTNCWLHYCSWRGIPPVFVAIAAAGVPTVASIPSAGVPSVAGIPFVTFCYWCVPAVLASMLFPQFVPLPTFPSVGDVLVVASILVVAGVPVDADFPIVASVFFTQKSDVE